MASFHRRLAELGFSSYDEYLASRHWQSFQARYRSDGALIHHCLVCEGRSYHLHHIRYDNLGDEQLGDVIPLCRKCHDAVHEVHRTSRIPLEDFRGAILKLGKSLPPMTPWAEPKPRARDKRKHRRNLQLEAIAILRREQWPEEDIQLLLQTSRRTYMRRRAQIKRVVAGYVERSSTPPVASSSDEPV